jgi:hypothetical protein
MSRLTKEWMETLPQVFGVAGEKGEEGEAQAIKSLRSIGFEVRHFPSDRELQEQGFDLAISKDGERFTMDVKANLYTGKDLIVDVKVLRPKHEADLMMHINLSDASDIVLYLRQDVLDLTLREHDAISMGGGRIHWVARNKVINMWPY